MFDSNSLNHEKLKICGGFPAYKLDLHVGVCLVCCIAGKDSSEPDIKTNTFETIRTGKQFIKPCQQTSDEQTFVAIWAKIKCSVSHAKVFNVHP